MDYSGSTYPGTSEGRQDFFQDTIHGAFLRRNVHPQSFQQQQSNEGGAVRQISAWLDNNLPKKSMGTLPSAAKVQKDFSSALEAAAYPPTFAETCIKQVEKVLDWYALPERVAYPPVLQEALLDEVAGDLGVKVEALQSLGQGTFDGSQFQGAELRDQFLDQVGREANAAIHGASVWNTPLGQYSNPEQEASVLAAAYYNFRNQIHGTASQREGNQTRSSAAPTSLATASPVSRHLRGRRARRQRSDSLSE